jgi:hypothetical protein
MTKPQNTRIPQRLVASVMLTKHRDQPPGAAPRPGIEPGVPPSSLEDSHPDPGGMNERSGPVGLMDHPESA